MIVTGAGAKRPPYQRRAKGLSPRMAQMEMVRRSPHLRTIFVFGHRTCPEAVGTALCRWLWVDCRSLQAITPATAAASTGTVAAFSPAMLMRLSLTM